ncbi:MAG: hypothetical protein HYV97_13690 [Bdellovibrio sp.]|nr:hypothetical protein [Bdellovibrio sp.]
MKCLILIGALLVTTVGCSHFNKEFHHPSLVNSSVKAQSEDGKGGRAPASLSSSEDKVWLKKVGLRFKKKGYTLFKDNGNYFASKGNNVYLLYDGTVYKKLESSQITKSAD